MNNSQMLALKRFFLLWLSTALTLWIVDGLLDGLSFSGLESLLLASLVLAVFSLTLKPLLLLIALPLTLFSFGLALPLLNGLVLLGVAKMVPGFEIAGFWMGVLCALAISLVGALVSIATGQVRVWGRVGRFDSGIRREGHHRASTEDHRVIDGEFKEKKSDQDRLPR
jgi:putative membrane protein